MPRYRRARVEGGTYFFTVVTERRRKILLDESIRAALRVGIEKTREIYPIEIDAWVLLPDHFHAIWTLPTSDADYSVRMRLIKSHVSKTCGERFREDCWLTERKREKRCATLWQQRFWEHVIRDEIDFRQHLDYVHFNPMKHKLVSRVADWPFSSFHRYVKAGVYGDDWGGDDRLRELDLEGG